MLGEQCLGNDQRANVVNANVACSVSQYTVTPSAGIGRQHRAQHAADRELQRHPQFTLTPSTGYHLVNVSGTCPAGSLSGNLWTTGAITANCTVVANFAIDTFTVAQRRHRRQHRAQHAADRELQWHREFTLTPSTGYHLVNVTGTCPAGSLSGNLWTTGAITANCTVIGQLRHRHLHGHASAGTGGSIAQHAADRELQRHRAVHADAEHRLPPHQRHRHLPGPARSAATSGPPAPSPPTAPSWPTSPSTPSRSRPAPARAASPSTADREQHRAVQTPAAPGYHLVNVTGAVRSAATWTRHHRQSTVVANRQRSPPAPARRRIAPSTPQTVNNRASR